VTGAIRRNAVLERLDAILDSLEGAAAAVPLGLVELREAIGRGEYDVPLPSLWNVPTPDLVAVLRQRDGVEYVETPPRCLLGVWISVPNGGRHRYAESRLLAEDGAGTVLRVRAGATG
jgi:hypothetical protein